MSQNRYMHAAEASIISNGTWFTPEAVAARALEQGSCVWHAAHTLQLEHLDDLGYGTCRICDGVTAPGPAHEVHYLCAARQARGVPTPQLDATPRCSCAKCEKARQ
jgi:hypothetical protein